MITIYTDGAARGNPGPGGWGAIIFDGESVYEIGGSDNHSTNNRMELTAAIKALEFVSKLETRSDKFEATIYTDSEYVMKGITEWIHSWQKKNWKTAGRKPVLNQDLWQELLRVTEGKNIVWKYVRGHFGHQTNERADLIATDFADGKEISLYNGGKSGYKFL